MINYYVGVLKNYVLFSGRARREEYWYFVLCNFIVSLVIGIITGLIGLPFIDTIYSLAVFLPSLAVAIRRMHDINKSGWFILIPIYNIVLCATPGDRGPNRFGEDPIPSSNPATENSPKIEKNNNIIE